MSASSHTLAEITPIAERADISGGLYKAKLERMVLGERDGIRFVTLFFLDEETKRQVSKTWSTTKVADSYEIAGDEMQGRTASKHTILGLIEYFGKKISPADLARLKEHLGFTVDQTRGATKEALKK
jgi:hypothetical protein